METSERYMRHAAPRSWRAEARGLTVTQDDKQTNIHKQRPPELLRPMRDASESAQSVDLRSRTDISIYHPGNSAHGNTHNLITKQSKWQNFRSGHSESWDYAWSSMESDDHREITIVLITEATQPEREETLRIERVNEQCA